MSQLPAPAMLIIAFALSACAGSEPNVAASRTAAQSDFQADPYSGRDGRAEALADLKSGKPPRLYSHVNDGEGPGYATPGLYFCDPGRNNRSQVAKMLFLPLPEADFAEDRKYTEAEINRSRSAVLFAQSYNLTMFHERRSEILKACPAARTR